MDKAAAFGRGILALILIMFSMCALAEPGDDASVASAKKYYEKALKTDDVGLKAAMKNALDFQLKMAEKRKEEASINTKSDGHSKPDKATIKS